MVGWTVAVGTRRGGHVVRGRNVASNDWPPTLRVPVSRIPCGRAKAFALAPAPCGSSRLWTYYTGWLLVQKGVHRTRLRCVPQIRRRQARSPSHVPCRVARAAARTRGLMILSRRGKWSRTPQKIPCPRLGQTSVCCQSFKKKKSVCCQLTVSQKSEPRSVKSPHGPTKSPCRRALQVSKSLVGPSSGARWFSGK